MAREEQALPNLKTLDDLSPDGQRVLVRVDFNVPVGDDNIVDSHEDYRIEAAMPTIRELQQRRCKIVLLTHYEEESRDDSSMEPIRRRLSELLREDVKQLKTLYGSEVDAVITAMEPGQVVMLPNVRSDEREKTNNTRFAEQLAEHYDVYVNEAFSVSHRAHVSVSLLPSLLPSAAGRRTVMEVKAMDYLKDQAEHPYIGIASGSKITTKVGMLRTILAQVDKLCIGGQIANIFLVAQGKYQTDIYNDEEILAAKALLEDFNDQIILPVDVVIGDTEGTPGAVQVVSVDDIPSNVEGVWDIGPKSVANFLEICKEAKTVMWNGPVGRFEISAYGEGTKNLALGLAGMTAYRVIGGGDTVSALETYRLVDKYDHVSVGGGAMIAYLQGKRLPGLDPLSK